MKNLKVVTLICSILAGLFVTNLPTPANAHSGDVFDALAAVTPTIDGTIAAGEWDDADCLTTIVTNDDGSTSDLTVCEKNDTTNLYISLFVTNQDYSDPAEPCYDFFNIYFDNGHDGTTDVGENDWSVRFDGAVVSDDYNPIGVAGWSYSDTSDGGTNDLVAGITHSNPLPNAFGDYTVEYQGALDSADDAHDFSLGPGDTVGFQVSHPDGDPSPSLPCTTGLGSFEWPAPSFGFPALFADITIVTDTDGDGLRDDWEQVGIDADNDGTIDLDLPGLGADPMHKDIFLEIDYMDCAVAGGDCPAGDTHSQIPKAAAVDAVIAAFAAAPVANPDGVAGINLHIDVSNAIAHQNFMDIPGPCGGNPLPAGIGNFDIVKAANFDPNRRLAFHYQLFVHRRGPSTTSSGCSELPGNDTIVALGEWNTACVRIVGALNTVVIADDLLVGSIIYSGPNLVCDSAAAGDDIQLIAVGGSPLSDLDGDGLDDRTVGTIQQQAGTLMHEFGHNLNLFHGGGQVPDSSYNYKPNYQSVMNYIFQMRGIPPDPDGAGPLVGTVDYSDGALADLVESMLDETSGIGGGSTYFFCPGSTSVSLGGPGAIDWDCDGDLGTEVSVSVDINGRDGLQTLSDFNDWANLKYDFQNTVDFADGVHMTVPHEEIDFPTSLEVPVNVDIDIKPGGEPNSINVMSKGVVPVAILTSPAFDASSVDPTTVRFGQSGTEAMPVHWTLEDVDSDGDLDLILQFKLQETGIQAGDTQAILTGKTFLGGSITATDSIRAFFPGDVNGNLRIDIFDAAIIGHAYGSKPGDANWIAAADFDLNNTIDILDVALMAFYYGTSY